MAPPNHRPDKRTPLPASLLALCLTLVLITATSAKPEFEALNHPDSPYLLPSTPFRLKKAPRSLWVAVIRLSPRGAELASLYPSSRRPHLLPPHPGRYLIAWGDASFGGGDIDPPKVVSLMSGHRLVKLALPRSSHDPYLAVLATPPETPDPNLADDLFLAALPGMPSTARLEIVSLEPPVEERVTIYGLLSGWMLDGGGLELAFPRPPERLMGGEVEVRLLGEGDSPPAVTLNGHPLPLVVRPPLAVGLSEFVYLGRQLLFPVDNRLRVVPSGSFWLHRLDLRLER